MSNDIEFRKLEHLFVCNYCDVEYKKGTLLEDVELIHSGISNCDLDDLNTSINLFGKKLGAPIIVAAITGGHSKAKEINKNIAIAVEELNLGMGVGSQRAALINEELIETYSVVRDYTSSLVLGNLGAVNFIEDGWNEETIHKAVEMIDADGMAIHFNPLQEAIQPEGDYNFKGMEILKDIMENYNKKYYNNKNKKIPFIAKQVGEGFSKEDALLLNSLGLIQSMLAEVEEHHGQQWNIIE